jgi:8-amino-7-oxononanoate synthase
VNFDQSFKYTTGLSLRSVAAILTGYQHLRFKPVLKLRKTSFQSEKNMLGLKQLFVHSKSAIQSHHSGNENVTSIAQNFRKKRI